ncbi:hypothetical protein [Bacillus cereus]|uniref:hypothetical protein n=1 Tax=Bacillus cereus TaxID=1396 RepID=UPI00397F2A54
MKDNHDSKGWLGSTVITVAGKFITAPYKRVADPLYWGLLKTGQHIKSIKEGSAKWNEVKKIEKHVAASLKTRFETIKAKKFDNQYEVVSLAQDLYIAFQNSETFRESWVVGTYNTLFEHTTEPGKTYLKILTFK